MTAKRKCEKSVSLKKIFCHDIEHRNFLVKLQGFVWGSFIFFILGVSVFICNPRCDGNAARDAQTFSPHCLSARLCCPGCRPCTTPRRVAKVDMVILPSLLSRRRSSLYHLPHGGAPATACNAQRLFCSARQTRKHLRKPSNTSSKLRLGSHVTESREGGVLEDIF